METILYHPLHGKHIKLSSERKKATRNDILGYGISFSDRPIKLNERVCIKMSEVSTNWSGGLRFGFTSRDPATLRADDLPKCACPYLVSKPGYWAKALPNEFVEKGKTLSFSVDGRGDVVFRINGVEKGVLIRGVSTSQPLWALIDLYGNTTALEFIGSDTDVMRDSESNGYSGIDTTSDISFDSDSACERDTGISKGKTKPAGGTTSDAAKCTASACAKTSKNPTTEITCPYWQACKRFLNSLNLEDEFFDRQFDRCFCDDCMKTRVDNLYYTRGVPPKTYCLPAGWGRFGLVIPAAARAMDAVPLWHVAYHGTECKKEKIKSILESQSLLMPGDRNVDGQLLTPLPWHFNDDYKPEGFAIEQVFLSPTIKYAGQEAYATLESWTDPTSGKYHNAQLAFQVRVRPESYKIGKETLDLGDKRLDENMTTVSWNGQLTIVEPSSLQDS